MSILIGDFTWLHSNRTIDAIIDISSKVLEYIYPSCCFIFGEKTFQSWFESSIEPFYNWSLTKAVKS